MRRARYSCSSGCRDQWRYLYATGISRGISLAIDYDKLRSAVISFIPASTDARSAGSINRPAASRAGCPIIPLSIIGLSFALKRGSARRLLQIDLLEAERRLTPITLSFAYVSPLSLLLSRFYDPSVCPTHAPLAVSLNFSSPASRSRRWKRAAERAATRKRER